MSQHFSVIFRGDRPGVSATRHRHRLFAQLNLECNMRVLEIGCGTGETAFELAHFVDVYVVGVDIDPAKIQTARARSIENGLAHKVSFVLVDPNWWNLQHLFGAHSFDGVYALESLRFAPSFNYAYGMLSQLLRAGGRLAVYEWCWTRKFDPTNVEHVNLVERLEAATEIGYCQPANRTIYAAQKAVHECSMLELLECEDSSEPNPACILWYHPIEVNLSGDEQAGWLTWVSGRKSKNSQPVGGSTYTSAQVLLEAARSGLFSPMVMLVAQRVLPTA